MRTQYIVLVYRIDLYIKEDFDIIEAINETFRHIKKSSNQLTKQLTQKI